MPKLNLSGLDLIKDDLNSKVKNSFITNVTVINHNDILLTFSFYNKEKLLISLNHSSPFIGFVNKDYSPHTVLGTYNDNLRKYVKGAYIEEINLLNEDRVLCFKLYKSDEFYNKQTYYLVLEFIPTISNLLFLNDKQEIIFAKHYADLSASRPILKGLKYTSLNKNKEFKKEDFDYQKYQKEVNDYIVTSDNQKKKEEVLPLYKFLKQKEKSIKKKIEVLQKEKNDAKTKLIYKNHAEFLLTYIDNKEELDSYIKTNIDCYDDSKSVNENANILFNKYKKNKRTIENLDREIALAEQTYLEICHILNTFDYLAEEEFISLMNKYLPNKNNKKQKVIIDASKPYFIKYKDVKYGFGKNKDQNNNLTFKEANKSHTFIHLSDIHASHVVIFKDNPSKEELEFAGEIALILAGKEEGEIQYAKISDIKKGPEKGLVILNKYQTFILRKVNNETKVLLKNQKRFS